MAKKLTLEEFIERAIALHGNKFDYSKVVYLGIFIKVIIICPIHGEFEQRPHEHLYGDGCPKCSYENNGNLKRSNLKEFIEKAKEVHGVKNNYSKFVYTYSNAKSYVTCLKDNHGDYLISPNNHLKGKGCPKCWNEKIGDLTRLTNEEFIEKARKVHGDKYNYDKVKYITAIIKVTILCPKHGEFDQIPNVHLCGSGCPRCNSSKGELAIKAILDKHNIKYIREYILPSDDRESTIL